jgi:hypothetical protein
MSEANNKRPRLETQDDLYDVIGAQNAAIEAMDLKLRAYMKLVDGHELALEKVGIMRVARESEGGKTGGSLAN